MSQSRITGHFGSDRDSFSNDYTIATDRVTLFLEAGAPLSALTMDRLHLQIRRYSDDLSNLMAQQRIPSLHFYCRGVVPDWVTAPHIVGNIRKLIRQLLQKTNDSREQERLRQGMPLSTRDPAPQAFFRGWVTAAKRAR